MSKKKLVIVESPNKTGKIGGFLGPEYIVKASFGHIRDLDRKTLSIDVDNNFKPTYVTNPDKVDVISDLKRCMKKCDMCYLASDFDREGESIAWHVAQALNLNDSNRKRILFTEITKKAVLNSLKTPGDIDMNMFNSQQARRILDRLIGYKITPILWKQIQNTMKKGESLSAGRVQSVVVKIIIDRENEIKAHNKAVFYKTIGEFTKKESQNGTQENKIKTDLSLDFKNETDSRKFLEDCKDAWFVVGQVKLKKSTRNPSAPFITSTLQQESSNKFKMSPKATMAAAQKLYECGYITYMRTDSVTLSDDAQNMIKEQILKDYGEKYLNIKQYKNKSSNSQEAHEAIRPCKINIKEVGNELGPNEHKLYKLIWKRTVASQMMPAKVNITTANVNISTRPEHFVSKQEKVTFDGFQRVYMAYNENSDDSDDNDNSVGSNKIVELKEGENLNRQFINITEKYTKPPCSRYTEASLIKELDKKGIGRPSTYSSIISLIQDRRYAIKTDIEGQKKECLIMKLINNIIDEKKTIVNMNSEKQKLIPTNIGNIVTKYLDDKFPKIMDYSFTAKIEDELDMIAKGDKIWTDVVKGVYDIFNPIILSIMKTDTTEKSKYSRVIGVDPKTDCNVMAYIGKYGPVVKLALSEDEGKDKFAPVKDLDIEKITLNEALELLKYPYVIFKIDGSAVEINQGKYGLYFKYKSKNYSLKDISDEKDITQEFIKEQLKSSGQTASNIIKKFDDKICIKNGKFGPYVCYKNKLNIKIYGKKKPEDLTLEDCIIMINNKKKNTKYKSK